ESNSWHFHLLPAVCGGSYGASGCHLVWSKNSCGLALVVFQQPTKPLMTLPRACTYRVLADRRKEQDIALALMIALVMIMLHVFMERMPQGAFAEQHHAGQRFVFDRSYPPLRVGI